MKTIKYSLFLLLLVSCNFLTAQNENRWKKVDQMHEKKWQFLVEQSKLSSKEIELVKPIFMEYEKKVWKQHAKDREFFRAAHNKDKNVKPNYAELNDRYADIELVQAQQFKNYHLKLRKILSPEALYNYYKAERDFKRKLLQDFPTRGDHNERR